MRRYKELCVGIQLNVKLLIKTIRFFRVNDRLVFVWSNRLDEIFLAASNDVPYMRVRRRVSEVRAY